MSLKAINPLQGQFIKAMKTAYAVEDECKEQLAGINNERMQFVILHDLIYHYRGKVELIDLVNSKLGDFKMGMDAKRFFLECADEIFRRNLEKENIKGRDPKEDIYSRMKRLSPLWGDVLMTA